MFKKLMRGSLLISLLLIVSISLSGCSIDIGKIVSGLTNTLGKITSGIGNFIIKAVDVAKKVVTAVKDVAGPIIKAVEDITGKTTSAAGKIANGIGKITGALDKVGGFGQKMVDTGEKLKEKSKDSAGNPTDPNAPTAQTVANPFEDEDTPGSLADGTGAGNSGSGTPGSMSNNGGNINNGSNTGSNGSLASMAQDIKDALGDDVKVEMVNEDGSTTAVSGRKYRNGGLVGRLFPNRPRAIRPVTTDDELMTKDEKLTWTASVLNGTKTAKRGINELLEVYRDVKPHIFDPMSMRKYSLKKDLEECKREIAEMEKHAFHACNYDTIKKFEALNKKLAEVRKNSLDLANSSEFLTNYVIKGAISDIDQSVNAVRDAIIKAYSQNRQR